LAQALIQRNFLSLAESTISPENGQNRLVCLPKTAAVKPEEVRPPESQTSPFFQLPLAVTLLSLLACDNSFVPLSPRPPLYAISSGVCRPAFLYQPLNSLTFSIETSVSPCFTYLIPDPLPHSLCFESIR